MAVERVRRLTALTASDPRVTVSAGICDTATTRHPAKLIDCADNALYWSKAHGRNRSWIYAGDLTPSSETELGELPLS